MGIFYFLPLDPYFFSYTQRYFHLASLHLFIRNHIHNLGKILLEKYPLFLIPVQKYDLFPYQLMHSKKQILIFLRVKRFQDSNRHFLPMLWSCDHYYNIKSFHLSIHNIFGKHHPYHLSTTYSGLNQSKETWHSIHYQLEL